MVCTEKAVLPVTPPNVAEMVVLPSPVPNTRPLGLTVAAAVLDEDHFACAVRFRVVPLEYVPVAVNDCVVPTPMALFVGVTAIDESVDPEPEASD